MRLLGLIFCLAALQDEDDLLELEFGFLRLGNVCRFPLDTLRGLQTGGHSHIDYDVILSFPEFLVDILSLVQ